MFRKMISLILILSTLCFSASVAETTVTPLEGLITATGDGYFLMNDALQGEVRVNLDASTTYEGTAAKDSPAVGQYVYVRYNGVMTRSLPPQVTAEKVSCFEVTGTVSAILDSGFTIEDDPVLGTVIVHMGDGLPPVYQGVPITLYYNGVMALSNPPQITAVYLVVPSLEGVASNIGENGFTLTLDDGTSLDITITSDTAMLTLPADEERLLVYYNGDSGSSVTALSIASPEEQGTASEM